MKRLIALLFIAVFITYLQSTPIFAQDQTEQISEPNQNELTIFYTDGLLDLNCSAIPLGTVLKKLSEKTTTKFVLTDTTIEKTPVTLSLQEVPVNNALKRLLRGFSYSSSFENNIEIVTIFPSHTASKKVSIQPVEPAIASTKMDIPIRPDTYIAPDTTIEVDDIDTLNEHLEQGTIVDADNTITVDDGGAIESDQIGSEEETADTEIENEQEDILTSLDEFMPIERPSIAQVYDAENSVAGFNDEQYRKQVAAEQEMRLNRSLNVLASNHTNLYNDALNEVVGINSMQATTALLQTATSEKEIDTTTKIVAAEGLWHHAADFGFNDPFSVAALQQMAQDSDPSVRKIGQQAIRDMERYKARQ